MSYQHIAVVVNFYSGGGSARRHWDKIRGSLEKQLGKNIMVFSTDESGSAFLPTQNAIAESADLIISVGGDGTHNEVANGILQAEHARGKVAMGIMPRGTGSDLRKTLKIPTDFEAAAKLIAETPPRDMDVGFVKFIGPKGEKLSRYFINILSCGIGGYVDAEVNSHPKWLGGKLSFMLGTLRALYNYKNVYMRVSFDDAPFEETIVNNLIIANGQYFGGGMWAAPEASVNDGLFDVVLMGDLSKRELAIKGFSIYKGKH